jgi:hypothetical protein
VWSAAVRFTKDESGRRPIEPSREVGGGLFFFDGASFEGVGFGVASGGKAPTMATGSSVTTASSTGIERSATELVGYSAPTNSTDV